MGIPIGPPSHRPAPKSAFTRPPAPMPAMYAALRACTGNRVTSACQMLLVGRLGQPCSPGPGGAAAGTATADGEGPADAVTTVDATTDPDDGADTGWAGAVAPQPTRTSGAMNGSRRLLTVTRPTV